MVPQVSLYHFYNILAVFLAVWFFHKKRHDYTVASMQELRFNAELDALTSTQQPLCPDDVMRASAVSNISEDDSNTTHSCHTDAYRASGLLDKAMSMVHADVCVCAREIKKFAFFCFILSFSWMKMKGFKILQNNAFFFFFVGGEISNLHLNGLTKNENCKL